MDSLKRKRTQQRREFTFAANAFETAINSNDVNEIDNAFRMLSETADNLFPTEVAVRDMWCDSDNFEEAAFETDQDKYFEYRQRWLNLQNRYRKLAKPSISEVDSAIKSVHEDYQGMVKKRINMPKLDLVKFDGNVKNWLLFWGQFKRIHEDTDLDDIDKFQFLLQSTVVNSSARQLIETYPPSGENYHKAIEALKARFARDDVLIETYVRGLLNLVLMRQRGQNSDLPSLYDNLQTHLQALETLGVAKDKYASVLFPMIESALPEDILRTWNRIRARNETKGDDLSKLIQFLRQEVESEERVQMARDGFINYDTPSEQPELCGILPKVNANVIEQMRKKSITLTDVRDCPDEISLLIGADFSGPLLTGEILHLDCNLTAENTQFGWTVQGPVTGIFSSMVSMTTTLHCLTKIDISDLWNLESLGIRDPAEQLSKADHEKEILDNFNKTISINDESRYEVCLPWHDNIPRPQSNYCIAKKRLLSTTARLETLGKLSDYDATFQEWLKLNIIELAPDQVDENGGMFLPHHAVIKESSQTTKIRPVFDASAKDINGRSLNSCLQKGVNLIELIPELLIDFRKKAIGVTADIAKAFLQISLNSDDRNYLKFLWWADINQQKKAIVTYRHRRVVFGVKSSPFHLAATINHHLDHCPPHLKNTAIKLKKSFYVDNCVTSVDTVDSMQKFITEAKEVMMLGNFDLRCWVTAPEKVDLQVRTISVLGIVWNIDSDTLNCNVVSVNNPESAKITKRSLLSVTHKIFDPIGVCSPATIIPKMILQQAWSQDTKWDEELLAELKKRYQDWMQDIHLISEIQIPRRFTTNNIASCKNCLHVFSDASLHAYSVCIFLRSEYEGKVSVKLVVAKSRVTPLKNITIPRLELIAATLATRMASSVIKSLNLPECEVQYWTDSSVVFSWIQGDGEWSAFVANRVREIKQTTNINSWKHVPGNMNPADLPSRGISIKGLLESRWWLGPSWLLTPSKKWPTPTEVNVDSSLVDAERKRSPVNIMLVEENTFLDTCTYFSSYTKILRMISWILRCKYRLNRKSIELTCKEIEYAEKVLFRIIQAKNIDKIGKLQTYKDKDALMRLETKLNLTNESFDFKSPIVLPGSNIIIQRMVQERHRILQHAGTQTLMANIRETFWIVGIRKLVKRLVRDCIVCKRYKTKAPQTHRASLPQGRVEASSAFEVSGVDLAGPLILRNSSKCWIVLFTCATYRAVHFEITESLTTYDFTLALRRFIARRGRVKQIYSDNGTNFTGFNNCLKSVDWNQILCLSSVARIKWVFIPPGAPWWEGFYERMVGVMKETLKKVLGRASLTLVELQTVLCDSEAIINNRPLTYITNSHDDLKPLTPAMFIQPLVEHEVPDLDVIDTKALNIRSAYCQKIREDLRRRFRSEYVSNLIHKGKQQRTYEVKVGDVVLLEIENEKRLRWPLAMVTEVYEGSDGYVSAAKVRTASGERVRPLQRLYPLEIHYERHDFTERPSTTVTRSGRTVNLPRRCADCF